MGRSARRSTPEGEEEKDCERGAGHQGMTTPVGVEETGTQRARTEESRLVGHCEHCQRVQAPTLRHGWRHGAPRPRGEQGGTGVPHGE